MQTEVWHRHVQVQGAKLFYREAGPSHAPTLLLLHGFPSSSHQYRKLLALLGARFRLIAPDYPGFGFSEALPANRDGVPAGFCSRAHAPASNYSFERLADSMEAFCQVLGLDRFFLYMFDFGGPVGMRLALRHPQCPRLSGRPPDAELRLFETGHFALEECAEPIAQAIEHFVTRSAASR